MRKIIVYTLSLLNVYVHLKKRHTLNLNFNWLQKTKLQPMKYLNSVSEL